LSKSLGWQQGWQQGNGKAARKALHRTSHPGVYRRGRRYVAVYRREGLQHKETVGSFAEARTVKVARDAEERAERLGPTLRDHALRYFPPDTRLGDLDREALQGFVTWLAAYRGERGRLSDRSIANVPLCTVASKSN
jgi:hypothetical protein